MLDTVLTIYALGGIVLFFVGLFYTDRSRYQIVGLTVLMVCWPWVLLRALSYSWSNHDNQKL